MPHSGVWMNLNLCHGTYWQIFDDMLWWSLPFISTQCNWHNLKNLDSELFVQISLALFLSHHVLVKYNANTFLIVDDLPKRVCQPGRDAPKQGTQSVRALVLWCGILHQCSWSAVQHVQCYCCWWHLICHREMLWCKTSSEIHNRCRTDDSE